MTQAQRRSHRRSPRGRVRGHSGLLLWLLAIAGAAALSYFRYRDTVRLPVGSDFGYYLRAARQVSHGRSPYAGNPRYVYPPTIALLLAPLSHLRTGTVWKLWVGAMVVMPALGAAAFASSRWVRLNAVWRPVLFLAATLTALDGPYMPTRRELSLGQADLITFPFVVLAALAAAKPRLTSSAAWSAVAGLLKYWPAAIVIGLIGPGERRWRQIVSGLVSVLLLAPVSAALFGWTGLRGLVANAFDARQQHLISDSVWSIPGILFSHSGLARPVLVSPVLRDVTTAVAAAWVAALLAMLLLHRGSPPLRVWNAAFCIILLLPVSHRQYALFVLPILWWWTVAEGGDRRVRLVVVAILVAWWINQNVAWPYNGMPSTISAGRYSVPFLADLIACTASVVGLTLNSAASPTSAIDSVK